MDFLPKADGDFVNWVNNYNGKLNTYGATVGLSPAEISGIQGQISGWLSSFNSLIQQRAALKSQTDGGAGIAGFPDDQRAAAGGADQDALGLHRVHRRLPWGSRRRSRPGTR